MEFLRNSDTIADNEYNFRDMEKVRDGIGEKVSHFLNLMSGFLIMLIVSFIYGWKLALIMLTLIPLITICSGIFGTVSHFDYSVQANSIIHFFSLKFQAKQSVKALKSYSDAANVAEEVLSGIRTVFAFGKKSNYNVLKL